MTRLDARLLVGLKGADLVATTATLALVDKMGYAGRLAGLRRFDFFHLVLDADEPGESLAANLRRALDRQSTFYNSNKHFCSLECRWNGEVRVDGPTHADLVRRLGGVGIDFDGQDSRRPAMLKPSPAFLVEVFVQEDDSAGRGTVAAKLSHELSGPIAGPGASGRVRVEAPSRATVWWLVLLAPDERAAVEMARQIAVTDRRDRGLLMNPHYQSAEFVSAGRIDPAGS